MYPLSLVINPEPEAHSGHRRLQKAESSAERATGMPEGDAFAVTMLFK